MYVDHGANLWSACLAVEAPESELRNPTYTIVVTAVTVVMLMLLGFFAGWAVFRPQAEEFNQEAETFEEPSPPPAVEPVVPSEDVPGAEIPGLTRYPGSVRTEYRRERIRGLLVTEAEYMVAGEIDPVREFYRELFQREGWSVGDLGFSNGEWVFFVIRGDQEAIVEIQDLGDAGEIELELSEPAPPAPSPAPAPQPQAQPQAPVQPLPQPPVADDDDEAYEYDDDVGGDDD